jgi:voltage-gated potassium channel
MIGYAIIAVPTGIVTSELTASRNRGHSRQACPSCGQYGHDDDATHCKFCGTAL